MANNRDRWRQVDAIFESALECPSQDRPAFLDRACAGELDLRREVEKMLALEERATDLMDTAAVPVEAFGGSSDAIDEGRFLPGDRIADRYRVVGLIGRGGMGEVYRADDLKLRQRVALKFLPERLSQNAAALARFYQEVSVARQISHRYVCRVYDVTESAGHHFLSMEYIHGEDLGSLLKRIVRPPQSKAIEMARQLCAGLTAIHEKGLLHRDLKPTNIMLDDRGQVRITDFGLAATAHGVRGREAQAGTPGYMSPEQVAGDALTARSDIYALGLVLHEIFTGKRAGSTRPSQIAPDLDPAVERVILRCLDRDPAKRPASAMEIAAALPGADPLAAALASGETPSPEMIAASPKQGSLRPVVAWSLFLAVLCELAFCMWIAPTVELYRMVPFPKSADVLEDHARQIAASLGYSEAPRDSLSGFETDSDYAYRGLDRTRLWHPPAFRFWYRQSPRYLEPHSGTIVTRDDPPANISGMISILLSTTGELRYLEVQPPQKDISPAVSAAPAWDEAFRQAGLDPAVFHEAPPQWVPPVACDARMAWTGAVRVEAAAWRGRIVYFEVVPPWRVPRRQSVIPLATPNLTLLVPVFLAVLGFCGWQALRNLRAGRGDRRGSLRFALFIVAVRMIYWATAAHHVPTNGELSNLLLTGLESAAFWGGLLGLMYLALEPVLRRHWPERLIGWSRLLAGEWRDTLVGRDLLVGILAGLAIIAMDQMPNAVFRWLGLPAVGPHNFAGAAMLGLGGFVPYSMQGITASLVMGFLVIFVLLFVTLLLRNRWAGMVIGGLALCAILLPSKAYRGTEYLPWEALTVALIVFLLMRFGVLAVMVALLATHLQVFFPITTELSAWYARGFDLYLAFLIATAFWGARASVAGRPLFGQRLLEE